GCVLQLAQDEQHTQQRQAKAADYKGRSGAKLHIDGVEADVVAHWSTDKQSVIVELRSYADRNAKFLRIDGPSDSTAQSTQQNGWFPKSPEISVPVKDPLADVTVR